MEYNLKKWVRFSIYTLTVLININCHGQQGQEKQSLRKQTDSLDMVINAIRSDYKQINSDSLIYKVFEKDITDESAEGGFMREFFKGDSLKKVVLVFFGETGKISTEYYFKDGEMIFAYEREDRYENAIYEGAVKIASTSENRYYFNNKKMVRWIGPDSKNVESSKYAEKGNEILNDLDEVLGKKKKAF